MALRRFGGNSGYIGYSMSKRAANARGEGKYPKTDFRKEYGLSETMFNVLKSLKIIGSYEWHHTGKYGRRTEFYEWVDEEYLQIFETNKNKIKTLLRKISRTTEKQDILLQIKNIFWE